MPLLMAELRRRLPPLYGTDGRVDAEAQVKFFTPWTNWTWYATEFDGKDLFFGLVDGHVLEMGYFSLKELEAIRGPGGLKIERDEDFEPTPINVLKIETLFPPQVVERRRSRGRSR